MRRSVQRQRLDEGDAQSRARLGVVGERPLGGAVDQSVEIGQAPKRLGGDGVGEAAVVRRQPPRRGVERRLERQALAKHGVEQAERGPADGSRHVVARTA